MPAPKSRTRLGLPACSRRSTQSAQVADPASDRAVWAFTDDSPVGAMKFGILVREPVGLGLPHRDCYRRATRTLRPQPGFAGRQAR
jgi:hypothetical protein